MEHRQALLIFQKNAVPGRVKTRLAATVGDEKALEIYTFLVAHTHRIAQQLDVSKFLFFSDTAETVPENWNNYRTATQAGSDLGMRMQKAFGAVFETGINEAIIIGTDCYELDATALESAFAQLATHDVVIGPAADGGYYLLGQKKNNTELFTGIAWSSEQVFTQTLEAAKTRGLTVAVLPVLSDIDNEADLKSLRELFFEA
jgi:uncharacterized protein